MEIQHQQVYRGFAAGDVSDSHVVKQLRQQVQAAGCLDAEKFLDE